MTASSPSKYKGWKPRPLVASHAAAMVLLSTWLWGPTRRLWDQVDEAVFFLFNGSLESARDPWLWFWAWANTRRFDVVAAVIMTVLLVVFVIAGQRRWRIRLAIAAFIGLHLLLITGVTQKLLYQNTYRESPSLVLEPTVLLSEFAPDMRTKDSSGRSFPSDHATVVLVFVSMVWVLGGWRFGLMAAAMGIIFASPRLVSGAHWLTDAVVGGALNALIAVSWTTATPLHRWFRLRLLQVLRLAGRCIDFLAKLRPAGPPSPGGN